MMSMARLSPMRAWWCLIAFALAIKLSRGANPDTYNKVALDSLDLNRRAGKLNAFDFLFLPGAHTGIAGLVLSESTRKFLAVSWYGREGDPDKGEHFDYRNRGVRISFVDVTSMSNIQYRHVLLVDENYDTFFGMHAGGLVYREGKLHVPDTRGGSRKVYTFDLDDIQRVPASNRDVFYNYLYILKQESSYSVDIVPSFMSFDWSRDQFLTGTYNKTEARDLQWYTAPDDAASEIRAGQFYKMMQGVPSGLIKATCGFRPVLGPRTGVNCTMGSSLLDPHVWT